MVVSLSDKLKQWIIPRKRKERSEALFEVDGRIFSDPRLHWKKSGRTLSKVGLLSWKAFMDGHPVKIYECHSEFQAVFVEKVSNHRLLGIHFPICHMRIGRYLVVEWVRGKPVTQRQIRRKRELLSEIARIQALIHSQALKRSEASSGFEYMTFIKKRLNQFKGILPIDEAVQRIYAVLASSAFSVEERLSHPDFTPANLILEEGTAKFKIVDNELLTQNHYYLIDLYNTHKGFGNGFSSDLVAYYLSQYEQNGGDVTPLLEHEAFFSALWYLRLIGSSLQGGAVGKALHLAQQYLEGCAETHPLVTVAKERFI